MFMILPLCVCKTNFVKFFDNPSHLHLPILVLLTTNRCDFVDEWPSITDCSVDNKRDIYRYDYQEYDCEQSCSGS